MPTELSSERSSDAHMLIVLDDQDLQMLERRPGHAPPIALRPAARHAKQSREIGARGGKLLPEVTEVWLSFGYKWTMGNIPRARAARLFLALPALYGARSMSETLARSA